jgi:hypothetical protein
MNMIESNLAKVALIECLRAVKQIPAPAPAIRMVSDNSAAVIVIEQMGILGAVLRFGMVDHVFRFLKAKSYAPFDSWLLHEASREYRYLHCKRIILKVDLTNEQDRKTLFL